MSKFWLDLVERAAATFVQAFAGALIPALSVSTWHDLSSLAAVGYSAAAAGIAAALSVVKSGIAARYGAGTASLVGASTSKDTPSGA